MRDHTRMAPGEAPRALKNRKEVLTRMRSCPSLHASVSCADERSQKVPGTRDAPLGCHGPLTTRARGKVQDIRQRLGGDRRRKARRSRNRLTILAQTAPSQLPAGARWHGELKLTAAETLQLASGLVCMT